MNATDTVTPDATPFTLLGHSSPSSNQGIVPTPAPNTENYNIKPTLFGLTNKKPKMYRMTESAGQMSSNIRILS